MRQSSRGASSEALRDLNSQLSKLDMTTKTSSRMNLPLQPEQPQSVKRCSQLITELVTRLQKEAPENEDMTPYTKSRQEKVAQVLAKFHQQMNSKIE